MFSTRQGDFRTATKVGRFLQGRATSGQLQRYAVSTGHDSYKGHDDFRTATKAGQLQRYDLFYKQDSYKGRMFSTRQDDFRTATKVGCFLQAGQLQR